MHPQRENFPRSPSEAQMAPKPTLNLSMAHRTHKTYIHTRQALRSSPSRWSRTKNMPIYTYIWIWWDGLQCAKTHTLWTARWLAVMASIQTDGAEVGSESRRCASWQIQTALYARSRRADSEILRWNARQRAIYIYIY